MTSDFQKEIDARVEANARNQALLDARDVFLKESIAANYSYNFAWLGRPIIQYPQDMIAMQEIIWDVRPDLIIETGIAHGGSVIMSASMLAMLDMTDAIAKGETLNPSKSNRKVLAIGFGEVGSTPPIMLTSP